MVAVAEGEDLVRPAGSGGEQQRGLVGLGAGGGEEDLGVGDGRQLREALGELDHGLDQVERRRVQHAAGLRLHRLDHLVDVVAGHGGEDAAEEVEVAAPLGVDHLAALAVDQRERLVVQQGEPRRQHAAVTGQQVGMGGHGRSFRAGRGRRDPLDRFSRREPILPLIPRARGTEREGFTLRTRFASYAARREPEPRHRARPLAGPGRSSPPRPPPAARPRRRGGGRRRLRRTGRGRTLAAAGREVVVLEKERLGWGAHARNGGMVIPELKSGPATLARSYGPVGTPAARRGQRGLRLGRGAGRRRGDRVRLRANAASCYLAHTPRHVPCAPARPRRSTPTRASRCGSWPATSWSTRSARPRSTAGSCSNAPAAVQPARLHAGLARLALDAGADVHDHRAGPLARAAARTDGSASRPRAGAIEAARRARGHERLRRRLAARAALGGVLPVGSFIIATEPLDPARPPS